MLIRRHRLKPIFGEVDRGLFLYAARASRPVQDRNEPVCLRQRKVELVRPLEVRRLCPSPGVRMVRDAVGFDLFELCRTATGATLDAFKRPASLVQAEELAPPSLGVHIAP